MTRISGFHFLTVCGFLLSTFALADDSATLWISNDSQQQVYVSVDQVRQCTLLPERFCTVREIGQGQHQLGIERADGPQSQYPYDYKKKDILYCSVSNTAVNCSPRSIVTKKNRFNLTDRSDLPITYAQFAGHSIFAGELPADWRYEVLVDGDQNGKWGPGTINIRKGIPATGDYGFAVGKDSNICPFKIYGSEPFKPALPGGMSPCDSSSSHASIETTLTPDRRRVFLTYSIPDNELFGDRQKAHVVIAYWDGNEWHHLYSPVIPLVLRRN